MTVHAHPLADGTPPDWASEWGHDEFGPWCSIDVDGIQQRLRWIPAGQFQMGVAPEFRGLFDDDDGPRQWVTMKRGCWMFESLCSQRLYDVVANQVSQKLSEEDQPAVYMTYWKARSFCSQLSDALGGVLVDLPTEAQWEFACRAGRSSDEAFDDESSQKKSVNPWGLKGALSGIGQICRSEDANGQSSSTTDAKVHDDLIAVRGLPRTLPPLIASSAISSRVHESFDWNADLHDDRIVHPSFRELFDSNATRSDVGFRCIIPQDDWTSAQQPSIFPRNDEDIEQKRINDDDNNAEDPREPQHVELDDTPLTFRLRDFASHLQRYYSELMEPAPGIKTRWRLVNGNPLCEAGRRVVHSIPDSVSDSNGSPNFPDRGGRLWYMLLRTSRRANFEDARPFLIAAAKDLALWLNDHYPNELPHTFVVGHIPLPLRIDNLRTILTVRDLSAGLKVGTGTGWPADQHPLLHAAVEVLVAIPDAITAPDGTPNFPGVGSALWPQLKNLVMTTDDSRTGTQKRIAMAQQFRDWLTNRYRTNSLEATGIEASPAIEKPVQSSSSSNESKDSKFDVFLSYGSADKEAIETVVAGLKNQGFTVFIDREHLTHGDNVNSAIRQAIRNSRCLVVCFSASELGDWQRSEIEKYVASLAEGEGQIVSDSVVPVMLPVLKFPTMPNLTGIQNLG